MAIQSFSAEPRVPDGFVIEKIAGDPQIKFPMFACFDGRGRLFVAESSGGDLYAEVSALSRKCRVSVLEKDFSKSRVFADDLVFPMGLAWRAGKLYVADATAAIAIDDTGKRTTILGGFGHSDNGSLHGLTFGPDGWLYMTCGQPDGFRFKDARGAEVRGKVGALVRCRPDGSQPELLCRGFENLVEIVFLPTGEMIGTDNWFQLPTGGLRDALVHLVEGGKYPHVPDNGSPLPWTGAELPAAGMFPAVALSGLCRYDGDKFPAEMRGNLFSAQHNARRVQRHVLAREGATWRAESFDFVTSDDPDFHPSDVLVASDGSLLVVDTGGWYVQHCPTGKIRASYVTGGIYRVRFVAAKPFRGVVVEKTAAANEIRGYNSRADAEAAKVRALGWRRDPRNAVELARSLRSDAPQVRLAAAEALAHCGSAKELPAIWDALPHAVDQFEEHALIHAAHWLADDAALQAALKNPNSRVQKAALLLLDQPPRHGVASDAVLARLSAEDAELREAAIQILQRHPDWAEQALGFIRISLESADDPQRLRSLVLAFQSRAAVQKLVADAITNREFLSARRTLLLEALAQTSLPKLPSVWARALGEAMGDADAAVRLAAVRAVATLQVKQLDEELAKLAENSSEAAELRLEALRAISLRQPILSGAVFDFLVGQLGKDSAPAPRLAASTLLARAKLSEEQAQRFQQATRGDVLLSRSQTTEDPRAKLAQFEPWLRGGDATRGREVFFGKKVACAACHRVGKEGGTIGPDLTKVGAIRSGRDLLESVLAPSSTFAQGYEPYVVTTSDGDVLSGIIARRTDEVIVLRDSSGAETQLRREQIREMKRSEVSIMPEGLERALTAEEFRDLMGFLQSLK